MADFNPYAPPEHEANGPDPRDPADVVRAPLFAISRRKLVLLSLATLGLYILVWMFLQWKGIRDDRRGVMRPRLSPFWRTLFGVIFAHALFREIRIRTTDAGVRVGAPTGVLAAMFIVSTILGRITHASDHPAAVLVPFGTLVPLVLIQGEINRYVAVVAPTADPNRQFSPGNIVVLVIGALLWAVIIFGTFIP